MIEQPFGGTARRANRRIAFASCDNAEIASELKDGARTGKAHFNRQFSVSELRRTESKRVKLATLFIIGANHVPPYERMAARHPQRA